MAVDNFIKRKLEFKHLPAFALFLKNHHLAEMVKEQLRLAREIQVPILKFFESVPEAELEKMSTASTTFFLDLLINNNADEQISNATKQWLENQLSKVSREQIVAEDITLVSFIRKQALLKFLPAYTSDVNELVNVIREIDHFIAKSETELTNTYIRVFRENLAEETYFKDSIADTSPGIIFIYDLAKSSHVYINEKISAQYGYAPKELKAMGNDIYKNIVHPDDLHTFENRYEDMLHLKDGEIKSVEYRLKKKDGPFSWMRNYQSVFKRASDGTPVQMIGIAFDIDKEKRTAAELEYNREQLLEAQELAGLGSFEWDLSTDISDFTPQLEKIFELPSESKFSRFIERVHPADRKRVEERLEKAIKSDGVFDSEFRYLADGKEKVLWSRGIVYFHHGQPEKMKGTTMDVTERHHMIQRLQRSEELYKQAQALSHMGNWTWDIKSGKITWTDELFRIFGLAPQSTEITLEKFFSFIHPEDRETRMIQLEESLKSHKPHEYFFRIVLPDGSIKTLSGQAEILLDRNEMPFKVFGACQDVTLQKRTEKQLLDNQNFISKIADTAPSIISVYNIHSGTYLFINKAFEQILGYKKEVVFEEGLPFFINLVHPDDLAMLTEKNQLAITTANQPGYTGDHGVIAEYTYRLRHKNGEYRWLRTSETVFERNANNEIESMLNISANITEIVNAENKVKEQEHFIQQVADASPTVLYLFDVKSGSIRYVNKEIENVLGYSTAEVIEMGGEVIPRIFHPEDAEEMMVRLNEYNLPDNAKSLFQFECRLKNIRGEWCWFLIREVVFQRGANGKVTTVLGAALDISGRKEMEDKLFHQTIALQQSNTSLEEFAYVASHDLKEPLRKIATFSDRLLTMFTASVSEDGQNYLSKIIDSSRRMQQLIDDLLSISMISGDRRFVRYNLKAITDEVLQTLEHKIEEKKAVIKIQQLPEALVIPSQFRQLFQNLLSNSLKFSRKDVIPEITITYNILLPFEVADLNLSKASRYLEIRQSDNGIGFEKVFAEKIFTIFQRLHNRSQYEGTGIGLAICKRIVENHGGIIFASGALNEGATFTIIIPHTV